MLPDTDYALATTQRSRSTLLQYLVQLRQVKTCLTGLKISIHPDGIKLC